MFLKMGCGVSNTGCGVSNTQPEDTEMKLPSCRLTFSQQQLMKLNCKFATLLETNIQTGKSKEKQMASLGVVVERLVQRLVCSVGNLDSRFSSKFLINLDPLRTYTHESRKCLRYKYLVRLDLLSTPALYPEFFEPPVRITEGSDYKSLPQGFAKIRVHGEFLEQWAEFISPNGFLRRDKIQEQFLELLTRAAARPSEPFSPAQVDESRHCGSPGKIVDPITLSQILRTPASQQVFFGSGIMISGKKNEKGKEATCLIPNQSNLLPTAFAISQQMDVELHFPNSKLTLPINSTEMISAECNESRFPDPRDFRIAIVEGIPETRLHISFLSPTAKSITSEDVEVTLTLGVGVSGWPSGTDFPSRLPLDHVDVMLGYRAAQLDYYLVPKGPHSSVYCEDRSAVWEIRALATEMFLEHHYSPSSVVIRVYTVLTYLLEIFKARGVKTINKYILKNLLFYELERKKRIQQWTPKTISRRVISILEQLLLSLHSQMVPSYIFPEKNILLQDDAFDDDYTSDRDIIEHYLEQLHNDKTKQENNKSDKDELENVLLKKWDNVIASMLPPQSNRTKRLNVINNSPAIISYTRQQMDYVALLIREVLKLKNIQRKTAVSDCPSFQINVKEDSTDKEDFLYLLQIMLDQAKQKLLTAPESCLKKIPNRKLLKLDQLLLSYDLSTAMLLDDIRRSKQTEYKFANDLAIVIKLMECLYKAMDSDGKVLGPVLRPYLNQIFRGSHENCCFLFEWNKKADLSEFEAIGVFCKLVLSGNVNPLDGILGSASKGWNWAINCQKIMQEISEENSTRIIIGEKFDFTDSGVRLILTPAPGKTLRFNVSTTKPLQTTLPKDGLVGTLNKKHGADSRFATIKSFQDVLESTNSFPGVDKSQELPNAKEVPPMVNLKLKSEKQPLHVQLREGNPFTLASMETRRQGNHRGLGSIVQALISLQKLTILQEISQYLPEEERNRVLSDIKKLSKEVQRAAVENYKKRSFSLSGRRNKFIVKHKLGNSFPSLLVSQKRISKVFSDSVTKSEPEMSGVYRSVNEFSVSKEEEEIQDEIKNRGEQLDEELKKAKEESLRWTCRELRKASRPTVIGSRTYCTVPKAGFHRKGSSTFPKSINTPFYIKVSSFGCKFGPSTTHFSNTLKQ